MYLDVSNLEQSNRLRPRDVYDYALGLAFTPFFFVAPRHPPAYFSRPTIGYLFIAHMETRWVTALELRRGCHLKSRLK